MAESNNIIDINEDDTLPIILNKKTFADFILNFLGKKEKLVYSEKCKFLIRLNDIEQFHNLFSAKLAKEQNVCIEHFAVTFDYTDNTSRTIHGIDAFATFNETRDVLPRSISMYWNVIMKYPNAETFENQTIECSFINNNDGESDEIILAINHTNQAWGIEVLNLFKDKIAQIKVKELNKCIFFKSLYNYLGNPKFKLDDIFAVLITLVFIVFFVVGVAVSGYYGVTRAFYNYENEELAKYSVFDSQLLEYYKDTGDESGVIFGLHVVNKIPASDIRKIKLSPTKINNVIVSIAEQKEKIKTEETAQSKRTFFAVISVVAFYILLVFYCRKAISFYENKSFIVINNRSDNEYKEFYNSKSKSEFYTLTAFIIAVFSGVVGNIIYSFL